MPVGGLLSGFPYANAHSTLTTSPRAHGIYMPHVPMPSTQGPTWRRIDHAFLPLRDVDSQLRVNLPLIPTANVPEPSPCTTSSSAAEEVESGSPETRKRMKHEDALELTDVVPAAFPYAVAFVQLLSKLDEGVLIKNLVKGHRAAIAELQKLCPHSLDIHKLIQLASPWVAFHTVTYQTRWMTEPEMAIKLIDPAKPYYATKQPERVWISSEQILTMTSVARMSLLQLLLPPH